MAETNKITLTLEPKKEETPVVEEENGTSLMLKEKH